MFVHQPRCFLMLLKLQVTTYADDPADIIVKAACLTASRGFGMSVAFSPSA